MIDSYKDTWIKILPCHGLGKPRRGCSGFFKRTLNLVYRANTWA